MLTADRTPLPSDFGVTFAEDAKPEAAVALALLLFADPDVKMPGGFSSKELSDTSPIKAIASFPQELVLLGRATVLIKGISQRLGIKVRSPARTHASHQRTGHQPTESARVTLAVESSRISGGERVDCDDFDRERYEGAVEIVG